MPLCIDDNEQRRDSGCRGAQDRAIHASHGQCALRPGRDAESSGQPLVRCDRLGDLVLALPAFAWLRRSRPDWEIHALVVAEAAPLVEHDPNLDAFYTWDGTAGQCRFWFAFGLSVLTKTIG